MEKDLVILRAHEGREIGVREEGHHDVFAKRYPNEETEKKQGWDHNRPPKRVLFQNRFPVSFLFCLGMAWRDVHKSVIEVLVKKGLELGVRGRQEGRGGCRVRGGQNTLDREIEEFIHLLGVIGLLAALVLIDVAEEVGIINHVDGQVLGLEAFGHREIILVFPSHDLRDDGLIFGLRHLIAVHNRGDVALARRRGASDIVKELEDELLKLRIENAYLKKLRRLRLEEEALLKKQRESSTVSEDSSN